VTNRQTEKNHEGFIVTAEALGLKL